MVLVKKGNGKWMMCVDFTDLNKACPIGNFPLLCIDLIVDPTARHEMMSYMEVYSRYNHIWMSLGNEEKMAFITDR